MDVRANLTIDEEFKVHSNWDFGIDTDEGCNEVIRQLIAEYGRSPTSFFKFYRDLKKWEDVYDDEVFHLASGLDEPKLKPSKDYLKGCWKNPFFYLQQGFVREMLLPQYKKLEKSLRVLKNYSKGMVDSFVPDDELTYGEGFADSHLQELLTVVRNNIDELKVWLLAERTARKGDKADE